MLFLMFAFIAILFAAAAPAAPAASAVGLFAAAAAKFAVPLLIGFACWLASGVLNWFLHWEESQDWDKWAGKNPKRALLVTTVRMLGLHVRPLVKAVSAYLAAQAKSRGVDPAAVDPANPPTT